jgi:hypothetical protein
MGHADPKSPTPHLSEEAVEAAAAGEARPATGRHIQSCDRCRRRVDELASLLRLLDDARGFTASPGWFRSRALAALRRARMHGHGFGGFLRCAYDSLSTSLIAGVRGPAGPGRQLLFEGSGLELDVHLVPPSEESPGSVTGQLTPGPDRSQSVAFDQLHVRLRDRTGREASSTPDGFGMFSLSGDWQAPLEISIAGWSEPLEAFVPSPHDIDPDPFGTP